ncbi:MAG: glycoside hydrolase family 3 C-terminal domain-containing protein [Oscillospiraceae bacterium]|jgi:beta-glucosidase|nr:glycoside hydrolase family 3 C-terminal domain-containing protein [Oscillospiraceae bacterium]
MKHAELISKMTLQEKARFCSGKDFWHLVSLPRLDIPEVMVADGPHGLRQQRDKSQKKASGELLGSNPAVCYPTAVTTAASWDPELLYEMGLALGQECLLDGVSVLLGPGVNIKRSPLCGRNFEYFSEDPYLTGQVAASFINGVQSNGVGTSLKHFATNNQEKQRMTIDSVVDERTLREIYLAGFETAVKEAQPWTVMNAYNKLNGGFCAENKWLLNDVLRDEWGFKGLVVTDWGANNKRVDGLKAGQDLEMPTSGAISENAIVKAVQNGGLDESVLDKSVDRILDLIFRAEKVLGKKYEYKKEDFHRLARKIGGQSMVLLKNEDNILPLDKAKSYAVIGEMAKTPRYQGTGSSLINPTKIDCAFDELLDSGINATFSYGYDSRTDVPNARLIAEAVKAAQNADVAIVFIGLTTIYEAEGYDRTHMRLPANHNELVAAVAEANPNTVVVLSGGSPVTMPWLPKVKGLLNAYLGGQTVGGAVADLLTGSVTPSGKLAETYPLALEDVASTTNFPGDRLSVEYREGIYVGYRYFDKAKKDVLFPFGFGLSYTTFEYSGMKISKPKIKDTDELTVSFKIKNTGSVAGAEIAQLYVSDLDSTIFRPEKELKGFKKIFLNPGETADVTLTLNKRSFAYYNVNIHDWHVESGDFAILVGASSKDIRLEGKVHVASTRPEVAVPDYKAAAPDYYSGDAMNIPLAQFEAVLGRSVPKTDYEPGEPLTMVSNFGDAKKTKRGAMVMDAVESAIDAILKGDPNAPMVKASVLEVPFRSMVHMSMGVFTPEMAESVIDIFNGGSLPANLAAILKNLTESAKNVGALLASI